MIFHQHKQQSLEWFESRLGVVTGSRFKDCRDRLKGGAPSKKCLSYAMDLARERVGGSVVPIFQSVEMRIGTEQEPFARMHYERMTGEIVEEAGFITTDDRLFGVSVDGLIGDDGIWECKTMVSSATLFAAVVDGDISDYLDQCEGELWLLGRQWVDLHLHVADLPHLSKVIRIERDDDRINALEADLIAFERLVSRFEQQLRGPTPTPVSTPAALPENLFA